MSGPTIAQPPVLAIRGLCKHFGGVRALRGATLVVPHEGTVHGLLGANGSGKSTLLGVLSGQLAPDAGQVVLAGREVAFRSPADALAQGIGMVTQETALAQDLSVAENILLGHRMPRRRLRGIDWRAARARARAALGRLELDYDPDWPVRRLRPDQQQMVEIARALSQDTRVLILDEPTSSLTDDEVDALFAVVRQIRQHGVCTVFVSHRLNEVFALSDHITVLRDGVTAAAGPAGSFTPDSLVDAMVGEAARGRAGRRERPAGDRKPVPRAPLLSVTGLCEPGTIVDVDLEVRAGEIVGVAGLVGSGCVELLEAIFGIRPAATGAVAVDGRPLPPGRPREAIGRGVGYLPPDRKVQGLVLRASVRENLTMVRTLDQPRWRRPRRDREHTLVAETTEMMRLRAASPDAVVQTLSGGNQQKVALGKWLAADPKLLLLAEPTRGVDVAAKREIHELLRDAAGRGIGLVVASAENSELLDLCDRIVVMFRGRVVASLTSTEASEALLAQHAGGHA